MVGWFLARLLESLHKGRRILGRAILTLTVIQGSGAIIAMQATGLQATSPHAVFRELRRVVPASVRVLGIPEYWLALSDREYRSVLLINTLSDTQAAEPVSFEEALRLADPDIVLVNRALPWFQSLEFWNFMSERRTRLIGELTDTYGHALCVYEIAGARARVEEGR